MSYQRQTSNGVTIESINGKHYINGVEVKTGRFKSIYYFVLVIFTGIGLVIGYAVGAGGG